MTMPRIVLGQPLLLGLSHAHTIIGSSLLARVDSTVSYLFLVGACSNFCSLDLVLTSCQLCLAVLLGASLLPGLVGCAHIVVAWLLQMNCTCFLNVQLSTHLGSRMLLCSPWTPTP